VSDALILGWQEWVALPALGLPALKAKIDTGARTSALHATNIETYTENGTEYVRFSVRPIPAQKGLEITATAPVVDHRDVTSSNGDKEKRYVISTPLAVGGRTWPIEITLTGNRETLTYRMLIGRQALKDNVLVDPSRSFAQPRLSRKLYGKK
jgi:ribosomal protein S6--L-glutamate ligase